MIRCDIDKVVRDAQALVARIESHSPAEKSKEWFAVNNLNRFVDVLCKAETKDDVVNASRMLSRFAVDSLEWGSDFMKDVEAISEMASKCARQFS